MVKQVIVMRTDLNMRKGKMCSQSSHASMKVFLDIGHIYESDKGMFGISNQHRIGFDIPKITSQMKEWIEGKFTKICVSVDSEQQLDEVYNKAKQAGIPCAMIEDSGLTEFNGVQTKTCCAIGPDDQDKINLITGSLKLL